jgi:ATP-dependent DNA helicase DinG
MPSRLLTAFPAGTPVRRVTLDEAVAQVSARHSALSPASDLRQQERA